MQSFDGGNVAINDIKSGITNALPVTLSGTDVNVDLVWCDPNSYGSSYDHPRLSICNRSLRRIRRNGCERCNDCFLRLVYG